MFLMVGLACTTTSFLTLGALYAYLQYGYVCFEKTMKRTGSFPSRFQAHKTCRPSDIEMGVISDPIYLEPTEPTAPLCKPPPPPPIPQARLESNAKPLYTNTANTNTVNNTHSNTQHSVTVELSPPPLPKANAGSNRRKTPKKVENCIPEQDYDSFSSDDETVTLTTNKTTERTFPTTNVCRSNSIYENSAASKLILLKTY